ncbi:MAG: UvrD-helicase domain-containing protein [Flavobacteriales bacterium]|nr:UvrD-helicase domain-containing protein [Flavobacteriales bacterium]
MNTSLANFAVYNSSAGSGKTFTLVKEYLKIALKTKDSNAYRTILAITFTNKAAAEMKDRIIETLQYFAENKEFKSTSKTLLELYLNPDNEDYLGITQEEIKLRSQKVLGSILHNYNDFAISTIDKFTTKIIRTFTMDLKLPLNFGIELNEKEVIENAVDLLLADIGTNEQLTQLLLNYSKEKADSEKSWKIDSDLISFTKKIIQEGGEQHLETLRELSIDNFNAIHKTIVDENKAFVAKVRSVGTETMHFFESLGITENYFLKGYIYKFFKALSEYSGGEIKENKTVNNSFTNTEEWYPQRLSLNEKNLIDSNKENITVFYKKYENLKGKEYSDYLIKSNFLKNFYQTAVINEIEKTIAEYKSDNNILTLSDFNKKISNIILTESIPFIYERLGEKYHHFMIDEFQDTSVLQWQNLIPLVENSLSNGSYNMVVGDAKQAIYRFRGGEVEQIINLPKIFNNNNPFLIEREKALIRNFKPNNLDTNFRSKTEIVTFNNQFFNFVSTFLSARYSNLYSKLNQKSNIKNTGGSIDILLLDKDEYKENTLKSILDFINQCRNDGFKLNDIAILYRNNNFGSEISRFLLENNISVISSEGLLINSSLDVKFILNLLKYISNPKDKSCHLNCINYLINTKYPEEQIAIYFNSDSDDALSNFLEKHNRKFELDRITQLSIYELVEYLINHFELSQTCNTYLEFFIDKIHLFATKNNNSILDFLDWWEQKSEKFSVIIPEGIEAVQVMSIHKSKGLDFSVVIYPHKNSKKNNDSFFWTRKPIVKGLEATYIAQKTELTETELKDEYEYEIEKSLLDDINVLYVAQTRPKNRLYIISNQLEYTKNNELTKDSQKNYYGLFCRLETMTKISENHYLYGKHTPCVQNAEEKPKKCYTMSNIHYTPWRDKISISYQAPKFWEVENPKTSTDYGKKLHQILSTINQLSDIDTILNDFYLKGIINQDEKTKISIEIQELLTILEIANFFNDYISFKAEAAILDIDGKSYQPDRILVKNNETVILDYKSGQKKEKHKDQILHYKLLLEKMGYQNVKCHLLYFKDKELISV